jgi:enamine deaminase RidA (YjgF/YER057c/UK114 family)
MRRNARLNVRDIIRIETGRHLSRVVIHTGIVYLAGVTADDCGEDIRGQTKQVLAKIDQYLAKAGTDKDHLLTAQIWLEDIARDFEDMNEIWDKWTVGHAAPTRATAQCEMAEPDILVEIILTAAVAG